MKHTHSTHTERNIPFTSEAFTRDPNPAALGGISTIETCKCGATRQRDHNGRHTQTGYWVDEKAWAVMERVTTPWKRWRYTAVSHHRQMHLAAEALEALAKKQPERIFRIGRRDGQKMTILPDLEKQKQAARAKRTAKKAARGRKARK